MAKKFHLTIARVGENVFDDDVTMLVFPGTQGVCTVLAHHEPLVSELADGDIHFVASDDTKHHLTVQRGGIVEISNNQVTVLL